MSDYFGEMLQVAKNEYGSKVSDGIEAGDVERFIDTGSYILNAQLSGSIYGGLPSNKITAFAGESSTGKTFSFWVVSDSFSQIILLVGLYILKVNLL